MAEKLLTLVTYTYTTESYILVAKLEAEGIKCFLKNENLLSTQQFLSNAVGGIDVQVSELDYERAKVILKELEQEKKNSEMKVSPEFLKNYSRVIVYCPECESTNVYRKKASLFSFGARDHICIDCQHLWKQ